MKALKIGIVEDDMIIAQSIKELLTECGYVVTKVARRYSDAIAMIEDEQPDLLLLDIRLHGKLDGIDVAQTIRKSFHFPFIFLTANSDFDTVSRAKEVKPSAFLSKPVTKAQLYAAIEIAIDAFASEQQLLSEQNALKSAEVPSRNYIFIKDGPRFLRVEHEEILFVESVENYVRLHLAGNKKIMARATFSDFLTQLDSQKFLRVHRSFAVAVDKIKQLFAEHVLIDEQPVPVSKMHRAQLIKAIGIRP